jgi:ABC-type methionine transport system ATPase subunit
MIVERKLHLSFPAQLLDQPLIYTLIRQHDVLTNILEADVTTNHGMMVMLMRGEEAVIDQSLAWLVAQGVHVEVLT